MKDAAGVRTEETTRDRRGEMKREQESEMRREGKEERCGEGGCKDLNRCRKCMKCEEVMRDI